MREYVALPHEYLEEMEELSDEEFGRLIRALLVFSVRGEERALTGNERFFYRRVLNRERRFQESYSETAEKRSQAGKKGAAARWHGKGILPDGENGHTETKAETKAESKADSLPSADGKGRNGPPLTEAVRREVERLERVTDAAMAQVRAAAREHREEAGDW